MSTIEFTITLTSDAEPGSGLAGEVIDGYITRDSDGVAVLRATHIKGLMRDRLAVVTCAVTSLRAHSETLMAACLGGPGSDGGDGILSQVGVTDARATSGGDRGNEPLVIARTALNELGTAHISTLRVTEAVAVGTTFQGLLRIDAEQASAVDLSARLALLAIEAVGGQRTRGAGACHVSLVGDPRTPGAVLSALGDVVAKGGPPQLPRTQKPPSARALAQDRPAVWYRLEFVAQAPVCCPERALGEVNVMTSGFAIPASAVQGALLHRLARIDPSLAPACLESSRFRAWPLLPAALRPTATLPIPTQTAVTHRMSKLITRPFARAADDSAGYLFRDSSIEPYDLSQEWVKTADGVLLNDASGHVKLWRSVDMPRQISAHGVQYPERNLFTVEAMAPMVWSGIIALPAEVADELRESLVADPTVAFGKGRSVRGFGSLTMTDLTGGIPVPTHDRAGRVFIVQSPLAIPDQWPVAPAAALLAQLVAAEEGWGEVDPTATAAIAGVRFGWSRHAEYMSSVQRIDSRNRLRARRCIQPGSVVVLRQPLDDIQSRLLRGVGEGRESGFGALLPHPGIAQELRPENVHLRHQGSRSAGGKIGLELWRMTDGVGPSPAQLGTVIDLLRREKARCLAHLDTQKTRPPRVWRRWKSVFDRVKQVVTTEQDALEALRVWQDLAIIHREEEHA